MICRLRDATHEDTMNIRQGSHPVLARAKALLLAAMTFGSAVTGFASPAADAPLQVERVLMVFRHGVRAPLPGEIGAQATSPWPAWPVAASVLTPHGDKGMRLLGAYHRHWLVQAGVLPERGCPAKDSLWIHSNTEQRTIASAGALADTLAPGCGAGVEHRAENSDDPLFHPVEAGVVDFDAKAAVASIAAETGGPDAIVTPYRPALDTMARVLGCASGCDRLWGAASLAPSDDGHSLSLHGPIASSSGTAEVFLLEYAEGMSMDNVGWGRASADDLAAMSRLHALLFDIHARPRYMAERLGAPLANLVIQRFGQADAPRLSVLVASDNNIAALASLLGVHFQVPGYGRDDPPPGGALVLELLGDAKGHRFVRVSYRAQTLQQLRDLAKLDKMHPPYTQTLVPEGCQAVVCAWSQVASRLEPAAQRLHH